MLSLFWSLIDWLIDVLRRIGNISALRRGLKFDYIHKIKPFNVSLADSIYIQKYFIHMKTSLLLVKGWECWTGTNLVAFYDKQRTQRIYSTTSRNWINQQYVNVYIKILGCVYTFFGNKVMWFVYVYAEQYLKIAEVSMKIEKSNIFT